MLVENDDFSTFKYGETAVITYGGLHIDANPDQVPEMFIVYTWRYHYLTQLFLCLFMTVEYMIQA